MMTEPPKYSQATCEHEWSKWYYTGCAYAWAILLFPVGILCCLRMKVKTCSKCGLEIEWENKRDTTYSASYRAGFAIGAVSESVRHQ